jgi:hypothetical protein
LELGSSNEEGKVRKERRVVDESWRAKGEERCAEAFSGMNVVVEKCRTISDLDAIRTVEIRNIGGDE